MTGIFYSVVIHMTGVFILMTGIEYDLSLKQGCRKQVSEEGNCTPKIQMGGHHLQKFHLWIEKNIAPWTVLPPIINLLLAYLPAKATFYSPWKDNQGFHPFVLLDSWQAV